jgi:hypothetical protein
MELENQSDIQVDRNKNILRVEEKTEKAERKRKTKTHTHKMKDKENGFTIAHRERVLQINRARLLE